MLCSNEITVVGCFTTKSKPTIAQEPLMIYAMRVRCGSITYVAMRPFWTEEPDGESIHPSGDHYRKRDVHCIEFHCTPSKGACLSQSQFRSRCYCIQVTFPAVNYPFLSRLQIKEVRYLVPEILSTCIDLLLQLGSAYQTCWKPVANRKH
ncbi:hypothetical protein BC629DRAFT_1489064 [Irpex lacteus]|nr:hypothetical protein BC629DRAFT_1489064 [Irpex lacteus]